MADKPIARQLAEIGEALKFEDIDQRTVENAKIFMLDCIGTILSGSQIESAKAVTRTALDIGGAPDCTIYGRGIKTNAMLAALVNGTAGHSQDYDDDHREGTQHASVAVLPAVLALAEKHGKSGKEALLAYIYGSDITIRAGAAFLGTTYYSGWHPTGTCGVFGATGAACKVLGLDAEQTAFALGVAGSEAAGIGEFNEAGAWTKRFHAGQSAMDGVLAAYLGAHKFFGPPTVFEGRHGFFNAFSYKGSEEEPAPKGIYDLAKMTDGFGKKWEMADNSIKLHSCCRFSNNFCDCAIDIHKQGLDPTQIESIHADCNKFTIYNLCYPEDVKRHPQNVVNAQFSLCYDIAVALVKGKVLPESFTLDAIKDPLLYELCEKTTWSLNEAFEAAYPQKYPARVTVKTKDGKTYVGEVEYPKGDPENPASKEEVTEKFFANAANTIGSVKAAKAAELIGRIETLKSIDELVECLY
ncbi:MAG: MmgE/PrpD family protein [Clostridiales Family XIII bacterium]|jgi:2-methylcitrate dehydratase PrpD|nr:MmgE/PrpD family protein [Clostridiales Family XIII bacterium]